MKTTFALTPLLFLIIFTGELTAEEVVKSSTTSSATTPKPSDHPNTTAPSIKRLYHYRWHDCHNRNHSCEDCIHNTDCYYCSSDKSCHYYQRNSHYWRQECSHLRHMYWDSCALSVQTMAIVCFSVLAAIFGSSIVCCLLMFRSCNGCRGRVRAQQQEEWTEMQDRRVDEMVGQQNERRQKRNAFLQEFRAKYLKRPDNGQVIDQQPTNIGKGYARFV